MTLKQLIEGLKEIRGRAEYDPERSHSDADDLLLEFIGDPEVKEIYDQIDKWYA